MFGEFKERDIQATKISRMLQKALKLKSWEIRWLQAIQSRLKSGSLMTKRDMQDCNKLWEELKAR